MIDLFNKRKVRELEKELKIEKNLKETTKRSYNAINDMLELYKIQFEELKKENTKLKKENAELHKKVIDITNTFFKHTKPTNKKVRKDLN